MGYIAPVTAYQYEDYKRRIEQAEHIQDPMPVTPTAKVEHIFGRRILPFYQDGKYYPGKSKKQAKELLDLTGKGRYVNEYV